WGMAGAAPAPADALGLRWYRIAVPGRDAWTALGERLRAHDLPHETRDRELHFRDPAGHAIVVEWI
ncbi:MAG TPA: VOC family protein, partial [Candidatus Thermoplasmatota archaeon]